jgi:hypothetical protein
MTTPTLKPTIIIINNNTFRFHTIDDYDNGIHSVDDKGCEKVLPVVQVFLTITYSNGAQSAPIKLELDIDEAMEANPELEDDLLDLFYYYCNELDLDKGKADMLSALNHCKALGDIPEEIVPPHMRALLNTIAMFLAYGRDLPISLSFDDANSTSEGKILHMFLDALAEIQDRSVFEYDGLMLNLDPSKDPMFGMESFLEILLKQNQLNIAY